MDTLPHPALTRIIAYCDERDRQALAQTNSYFQSTVVAVCSELGVRKRLYDEIADWQVGDLVWASMTGYRFWPALIANVSREDGRYVQVKFLNDNGRTAWISQQHSVISFGGLESYRMKCKLYGRRNKSYKATKNDLWTLAVLEAEALDNILFADRFRFYENCLLPAIKRVKYSKGTTPLKNDDRCILTTMVSLSSRSSTFVNNETKFNNNLWKLNNGLIEYYSKRQQLEKKIKVEPEIVSEMPEPALNKIIKKEEIEELGQNNVAKKKRLQIDQIVRNAGLSSANELFTNVPKKPICQICLAGTNVVKCAGICNRAFHTACNGYAKKCTNCEKKKNGRIEISRNQMYCIECAAIFPRDSRRIPAGTRILSSTQLLCPRHDAPVKAASFSQCLACGQQRLSSKGGRLVACQTCSITIHEKCLSDDSIDPKSFVCMRCEAGILPLYGEFVWVKYHNFPWWPAITIDPNMIPATVQKTKPENISICVYFFGSHEYGWVAAPHIHPFEIKDVVFCVKRPSSGLQRAMDEAIGYLNASKVAKEQAMALIPLKPEPYTWIKSNRIPAHLRHSLTDVDFEAECCGCSASELSPCGPKSTCYNQACYIECDEQSCNAGIRCQNRCFANGAKIGFDVGLTQRRGFGLFAKQRIPPNAFLIEYVGEVIDRQEYESRLKCVIAAQSGEFYFMHVLRGIFIDAVHYGNESRFINHSCDPNTVFMKWIVGGQFRIGIYAIRDIKCGEELTMDYKWMTDTICQCGASNCRAFI